MLPFYSPSIRKIATTSLSRGYDVFDVLREYWTAMLKANALYMMFARECQGK